MWYNISMINTQCWLYAGAKDSKGYGHFWSNNTYYKAYRVMYEAYKGQIPKELELDHLCRVPDCINPEHLEAVTHAENVRRGSSIVAINAKKTHCNNGHEFNEANTHYYKGFRRCRACNNEARKRYVLHRH